MSRRRHPECLAALLILVCAPAWAETKTPVRPTRGWEPVAVERLLSLEQKLLPAGLADGPWSHETLPDFYWAENRELWERFARTHKQFAADEGRAQVLTLVAGAAGVGKTFIKHKVYDKTTTSADAVCKFDVRELYEQWQASGITWRKPDLASGEIVLNRLLSVKEKSTPHVRHHLERQRFEQQHREQQHANFIVIDSLDEIHPDDCAWVLGQVADYLASSPQRFVHAVVFGRHDAFRDFWHARSSVSSNIDLKFFFLHPPQFSTVGDLIVSSWNYHCWKYDLKWSPTGGELRPIDLPAYADWIAAGFARSGRFATIAFQANREMRPEMQRRFTESARRCPVFNSTLTNLAGNSLAREIQQRELEAGRDYDQRWFMNAWLTAWMIRDTKSSDRPSASKPAHLAAYLQLLEAVAVRYVRDGQLDDSGYFPVGDEDTVSVRIDGRVHDFRVKQVLDRSGLKVTDPRLPGTSRYRFEPFWVHRLLVDRHNESTSGS